jgi:hypothetical protein
MPAEWSRLEGQVEGGRKSGGGEEGLRPGFSALPRVVLSADSFSPHTPPRQVVDSLHLDQPSLQELVYLLQIRQRACLVPYTSESTGRSFVPLWQYLYWSLHVVMDLAVAPAD